MATKYNFPERLKELRKERGMNRKDLTAALKLGRATVKRWEEGEQIPNALYIFKICQFFRCTAEFLLGLNDE